MGFKNFKEENLAKDFQHFSLIPEINNIRDIKQFLFRDKVIQAINNIAPPR